MKVPIGISARHTHLTKEHLEIFGSEYSLKVLKELSQPGICFEETISMWTKIIIDCVGF